MGEEQCTAKNVEFSNLEFRNIIIITNYVFGVGG